MAADLRESGDREFLNYGHTLGPRDREERAVPVAARGRGIGRPGVRGRAGPARRSHRRRTWRTDTGRILRQPRAADAVPAPTRGRGCTRRCRSTRRRAAARCGSWSSTAWPVPGVSRVRTRRCWPPRTPKSRVRSESVTTRRVLVLNGPNLGMLGAREPDVYGTATFADLERACREAGESLGPRASRCGRPTTRPSWSAGCTRRRAESLRWSSTRRVHALLVRAARRRRDAHRPADRGAPDQPGRARGVPPSLGRR